MGKAEQTLERLINRAWHVKAAGPDTEHSPSFAVGMTLSLAGMWRSSCVHLGRSRLPEGDRGMCSDPGWGLGPLTAPFLIIIPIRVTLRVSRSLAHRGLALLRGTGANVPVLSPGSPAVDGG